MRGAVYLFLCYCGMHFSSREIKLQISKYQNAKSLLNISNQWSLKEFDELLKDGNMGTVLAFFEW